MKIFYWSLRYIVRQVLQIYFKKVILQGEDKIDPDKPLLLAVNHPNSFLDGCIIACWLKIELHFIVRGDVFHPAFRWFFSWTNQIPIYRFRDGFSKLRTNEDTFIHCYEKLNEGKKILIFSEGGTRWTKQLRTIQRGAGRIAEGALKSTPSLDLQIIPIGINYEDVFKFRSTIEVKIGEPIEVPPLIKEQNSIRTITGRIHKGLSKCVVHLDREKEIPAFNLVCESQGVFELSHQSKLQQQFSIANSFNAGHIESDQYAAIQYLMDVKKQKRIRSIQPSHIRKPFPLSLYLWWPVHFLLYLIFAGPAILAKLSARKLYDHPAFEIPIRIAFGTIYYFFYILAIIVILLVLLPWEMAILLLLLFLAFAWIYPFSVDNVNKWRDQIKWYRTQEFNKKESCIKHIQQI